MLAPFATLAFLATLWLVGKLMIELIASDGAKIAAALRGQSMIALPPQSVRPVSVRFQPRAGSVRRPMRAQPEWRAAA
ncbi:MAG: hypothetical protein M3Q57_05785 [Pseudomonadota bacterium]|nr:hypothetical protein [Pseudomonadota bacterium]